MNDPTITRASGPDHPQAPGTTTAALPDPATLNTHQLQGHACARCGYRLYQSILIGTMHDGIRGVHGGDVELYACLLCTTPEERAAADATQAATGRRTGYCCFCQRWASDAVLVVEAFSDSGPGFSQYAHRKCAEGRGVKPIEDPAPQS